MGCDEASRTVLSPQIYFNPRIPYGMRPLKFDVVTACVLFQSTHPVWDATGTASLSSLTDAFQSTHPVWDATAARAPDQAEKAFQSTHPVWDATWWPRSARCCPRHFNPRIPYGMRQLLGDSQANGEQFQSTHPVWDATRPKRRLCA